MKDIYIPVSSSYLLAGLLWRPFTSKNWAKDIREAANERSASSYALIGKPGKGTSYFALINESEYQRSKVFSLSVVLAKYASDSAAAVILHYDNYYAVSCVFKNTVVIDKIFASKADAVDELTTVCQRLGITPKCNVDGIPGCEYVEGLEAKLLGPKKGRVKPISEIPQSNIKYIVMGVILLGGVYGYYDHQQKEAAKREAARLAAEREADPVPKYMRQLALDEPTFALTDATVLKMMGDIAVVSQKPKGWTFDQATCKVDREVKNQKCQLKFKRIDGIYTDLQLSLPKFIIKYGYPANLNEAIAEAEYADDSFTFPVYEKTGEEFIKNEFGNKGQEWLTAGLGVEITQPILWPMAAGVPPTFNHPMAKFVGDLKVTSLPLYLMSDLLYQKPKNSHVKSFVITAKDSKKNMDAEVTVDMVYHVKK